MTAAPGHVELIDHVAGRQGHLVDFGDVPAVEQDAAAGRVVFQGVDDAGDLIVFAAVRPLPATPLLAIDRPEIAPLGGEGVIIDNPLSRKPPG